MPSLIDLNARDPVIMAEVERLLAGRTRDIRLQGALHNVFRQRVWVQTAKIIRSWMMWVTLLNGLTLAVNAVILPQTLTFPVLLSAGLLPPAAIGVLLVWRSPRPLWVQAASLTIGMFLILLSIALVGNAAGGEFHERYLNIMLFVAISAIIIFGIPLAWTSTIAATALGLYLVFQLLNPGLNAWSALAGTIFFASGIIATVIARRTITLLAQKTFLLELRDRKRVAELAAANDQLGRLARIDPLTGVANRRWMTEILDDLWSGGCPSRAAMLMVDIDDFKGLNDHFGHAEGDRCLVAVAAIIQNCVRQNRDQVARYGGEEFLVLLPGVDERCALKVAERIRRSVETASLLNPASRVSGYVSVSIGVAVHSPEAEHHLADTLQSQADEALYLAKQSGRNRVVLYGDTTGQNLPSSANDPTRALYMTPTHQPNWTGHNNRMTSATVYRSSNGDDWLLETDSAGSQTVIHRANASSGGTVTQMPVEEFLERGGGGPEVAAVRTALELYGLTSRR